MAALCGPPAAARGADLGLEVRATPDSRRPLERIALSVPPWGTDAVRTVYVLGPRAGPLEGVRFVATVDDEEAAVSPAGPVTAPGRDGALPLRISVPEPRNEQTGALVATVAGRGQTLAAIAIKRDARAVVSVAGADDRGVSRISRSEATVEQFTLVSGADSDITDLHVRVAPLRNPEGRQVPVQAALDGAPLEQGRPYTLPARGTLTLTVRAPLEVAGEHRGSILLDYGAIRTAVPLAIRRTRVAPTIALADPGAVQLVTSDDKDVFLEVRETGGHSLELPVPSVVLRRAEDDAALSVPAGRVLLDGRSTPVRLEPGEARPIRVSIPGLDGPGEYVARLSFGGEPQPREATATVFIRYPFWIALVLVLAAVALSEAGRELRTGRLAARRRGRAMAAVDGELGTLAALSAPAIDEQLEHLDRVAAPRTGDGRDATFTEATRAVRAELVATRQGLERIAAADSARTEAWRAWFEAAADAVGTLVERAPTLPGVSPAGRGRLQQQLIADIDEIRAARDPRLAVNRYCDASAQFLDTAATGLLVVASGDHRGAPRTDVGRLADGSASAARSGDLARAWSEYLAAAQVWNGSASRRVPDSAPAQGRTSAALSLVDAGPGRPGREAVTAPAVSPGREAAVSVLAGAIASVAALIVLYEPDRSWGTFPDLAVLVAFVVAMHQLLTSAALRVLRRAPAA